MCRRAIISQATNKETGSRIPIFGEILYDCFENGQNVLGGAPLNVAWHLKGFGHDPLLISCVGDDSLGHAALDKLERWGLDLSGIQLDPDHGTGTVQVSVSAGQPSFDIVADRAFDHIQPQPALQSVQNIDANLILHGTLGLRQPVARNAWRTIMDTLGVPAFVDINLRAPWWNLEFLKEIVHQSSRIKVNNEELFALASDDSYKDAISCARQLKQIYDLEWLIVTCGEKGAFAVTDDGVCQAPATTLEHIVDTVGAGDAFTSICIHGLLNAWPLDTTLKRAGQFAAEICQQQGALIDDQQVYDNHIAGWRNSHGT